MNRTYPDHYKNKNESMRLVSMINNYWLKKGYPQFSAWLEEQVMEYPNGRKERVYNIRSNIRLRATPG